MSSLFRSNHALSISFRCEVHCRVGIVIIIAHVSAAAVEQPVLKDEHRCGKYDFQVSKDSQVTWVSLTSGHWYKQQKKNLREPRGPVGTSEFGKSLQSHAFYTDKS